MCLMLRVSHSITDGNLFFYVYFEKIIVWEFFKKMYMNRTSYADVLLGFSVYRHNFFGGIHVAQHIPVIIDNRHGSNGAYYSLCTPLALRIMNSQLTSSIICCYFMIACPEHLSLLVVVAICIRCFLYS